MKLFHHIRTVPSSLVIPLFLFPFLFCSWQCFEVPPDPVMPRWDIQLSVPLIDTVFYLKDALKDNKDIITDGPRYIYQPEHLIFDSVAMTEGFALHPEGSLSIEKAIGTFRVSTQPVSVSLPAQAILDSVSPTPVIVPPFSKSLDVSLPSLPEFEYVHFSGGDITFQLHNSFPFDISLPAGLQLYNQGTNELVVSFPSAVNIPAHSTWSPSAASLTGKTVRKQLKATCTVSSAGSTPNSVVLHPDSGLILTTMISQGEADEMQAQIFQRLDFSASFSALLLDDSSFFQQARLKNGRFRLQFQNTIPIGLTARFSIAELQNVTTHQPFIFEQALHAEAVTTNEYTLNQWQLLAPGAYTNSLTCSLSVSSSSLSSSTPITLRSSDVIRISLTSLDAPFEIQHITGIIKPTWFSVNDTIDLDMGNISSNFTADSVLLDSLTMRLQMFCGGGFPTDFHIRIDGISATGFVIATTTVTPGGSPNPAMFRLAPNQHGSAMLANLSRFVSTYLTNGGKHIVIRGAGEVNPADVYATMQPGTITDTSHFFSSMEIRTPLSLGVFNGVFSDTVDISNDGEDKIDKDILTKIKQASVYFKIENAMRMGVQMSTSFRNINNSTILSLPQSGQAPIAITAGTPSAPTSTPTPIRVGISTAEAEKFNDAERVIIKIFVNSADQYAKFTNQDYIRIRAYANIIAEINDK